MTSINGEFVHLHIHTEYSLNKAACRIEELIHKAKSWNMNSLAITDKGSINGVIRFYELVKQLEIHPIIGCEITVNGAGETLILLAASNRGYRQIVKWLNSESLSLPSICGDVIALSGGSSGTIHRLLARGDLDLAKKKAMEYVKWFGAGNFYLEIQDHGFEDDRLLIDRTITLSEITGIPLVATHDVHYLNPDSGSILDILQNKKESDRLTSSGPFYLPSPDEMKEKFRDFPEAIVNTVKIAERCQFKLEEESDIRLNKSRLPAYPVPKGHNEESYLQSLCAEGLLKRFGPGHIPDPRKSHILERMNRELHVINNRGLTSYFLILWDVVQFAKRHRILTGPGRGSAAGSLVAYLLGITEVNPLLYHLSFERFLSPDRPDLPDIDLDVCQIRRTEILDYMKKKYGTNRVAHIGVLNTYGTRGAVRQAGKYVQFSKEHLNILAKLLPPFTGRGGIRHCLETLPELQELPLAKEPYKSLFSLAESIEGLPKSHSCHPSAIIIGENELASTVPLKKRPAGELMTSFNKDDIHALGLLKIDLLGLRNLTIIQDTFKVIQELSGEEINLQDIPLDDPKTFEAIAKGETIGCFQLESMGIRHLMRRMQPKNIEDLSALLALYRPGAWEEGIVETYLRRRDGLEKARFLIPEMESVLADTCGLILYQEQVMEIVHLVAGYSMGQADSLRRALSKKSAEVVHNHREWFITGSVKQGRSEKEGETVFDFLTRFAGYSFNKAHSVSYAYIAYWTVFLKTHYPKEYMASLLSLDGGYYDKKVYLGETVKRGIRLLRPDVNRSGFGFRAEEEGIRVGMDAIKGSGPESVAALLRSRNEGGTYTSVSDLRSRLKEYRVKESVIGSWIASGACDGIEVNRDKEESIRLEKMLLGFSLKRTISHNWREFLIRYQISSIDSLYSLKNNTRIRICGSIVHSRRHPTENGEYVLTLVLQDHSDLVEVVLYPKTYREYLYELSPEGIIVEGMIRTDEMTFQVAAEKIKAFGG